MDKATQTYSTYVTLHIYLLKQNTFQKIIFLEIKVLSSKTLFFKN